MKKTAWAQMALYFGFTWIFFTGLSIFWAYTGSSFLLEGLVALRTLEIFGLISYVSMVGFICGLLGFLFESLKR